MIRIDEIVKPEVEEIIDPVLLILVVVEVVKTRRN